jgi:hypothetical protein
MKEFKKASQLDDEPVKKEPETKDNEIKTSDKK